MEALQETSSQIGDVTLDELLARREELIRKFKQQITDVDAQLQPKLVEYEGQLRQALAKVHDIQKAIGISESELVSSVLKEN